MHTDCTALNGSVFNPPPTPCRPTQVFAAAMAEARGRRLHWRTLERLTRMHEEELREGSIARSELFGSFPDGAVVPS